MNSAAPDLAVPVAVPDHDISAAFAAVIAADDGHDTAKMPRWPCS